jgi:hypothetical protein
MRDAFSSEQSDTWTRYPAALDWTIVFVFSKGKRLFERYSFFIASMMIISSDDGGGFGELEMVIGLKTGPEL